MENDQKERLNCALGRISSAATSATATMQEFSASMSQLSEAAADQQTNDGQQIAKPEKKRSWKTALLLKLGLVPYTEVCKIRIEIEKKHRAELKKMDEEIRGLETELKTMLSRTSQIRAGAVVPRMVTVSADLMLPKDAAEINNQRALRHWMLIQMEDKLSSFLRVTEADKQDTFFRYFKGSLTVVVNAGADGKEAAQDG